MKPGRVAIVLLLLLSAGLVLRAQAEKASAGEAVTAVLHMQAEAWNRGDLDAFMTGYLRSADTSYTSGGTEVWGYDALRERYQKKYGDSRATMGKLLFSNLKVFDLSNKSALCVGHWNVEREGQPGISGIFSLVFVRADGVWKIMHDHTSVVPAGGP